MDLQYFFDNQNSNAGDLIDPSACPGPGRVCRMARRFPPVPGIAYPRPQSRSIALTSPADGTSILGSNVHFSAAVTNNGVTLDKVEFYLGDTYWGEDATAPFELDAFVWAAPDNPLRARLFYNTGYSLDSATTSGHHRQHGSRAVGSRRHE